MATVNAVELPTEAEYRNTAAALQAAHDAVERLALRLDQVDEAIAKPTRLATAADVGLLWSFSHDLRGRIEELNAFAGTLELSLSGVDIARIEGFVADEAA